MRLSQLFGKTLREEPAEAETISHKLLLKAGMISPLAAGVYSIMPLAWRSIQKIENIIRDEMNAAGSQELHMPVLQPLEIWEESGRRASFGANLFTLKDRKDRQLVLGPTHEEVITLLVKQNVRSYRDLPQLLYQIQTKFRDEPRSRGGLLRVREFDMKDMYSFDADQEGLETSYQKMLKAYSNIFRRCGLPSLVVEADSGAIGGKDSHEFILTAESGEDRIISCAACGYAANAERARSVKPEMKSEEQLPLTEVATSGMRTIEEVSQFLKVPKSKTLKAVFYWADGSVIFVVVRGDLAVNEVKLKNLLKVLELRLATDHEVKTAGLVAGYASPIGLRGVKTVADDSIKSGSNFVVGANKADAHYVNANYPRDFAVDVITDIASAEAGHACTRCGKPLGETNGIEVGHIFKLGTFYSEKMGAYYLDKDGTQKPIIMGCYGIGVGRILGAAVEQNHDENGIVWPVAIAPYQVHISALSVDSKEVIEAAGKLHDDLQAAGVEVLLDDRPETPGVKFKDADLLGMPLRLTVSPRTMKTRSFEIKKRKEKTFSLAALDVAVETVKEALKDC